MDQGGDQDQEQEQQEFFVNFFHSFRIRPTRLRTNFQPNYGGARRYPLQITEVSGLLRTENLSLGSGMGLVVDLEHVFDGELRVALSGGEPLVPQHLLYGAQVGAFLQHVSSKSVAQRVRVDIG